MRCFKFHFPFFLYIRNVGRQAQRGISYTGLRIHISRFWKEINSDKRCNIGVNGDVPTFRFKNLSARALPFALDDKTVQMDLLKAINPSTISSQIASEGSYERKIKTLIENKLCGPHAADGTHEESCPYFPITIDMAIERCEVTNTLLPDNASYYGVLVDNGSSSFLLSDPRFVNVHTVMSDFDEAPKTKSKRVYLTLNVPNTGLPIGSNGNILIKNVFRNRIEEPQTKRARADNTQQYAVNTITFMCNDQRFVSLDHTVLSSKILNLSVRKLCGVIASLNGKSVTSKSDVGRFLKTAISSTLALRMSRLMSFLQEKPLEMSLSL